MSMKCYACGSEELLYFDNSTSYCIKYDIHEKNAFGIFKDGTNVDEIYSKKYCCKKCGTVIEKIDDESIEIFKDKKIILE